MRSSPRFSIITVCFNDRPNLLRTADSVTCQSYPHYEWVVIDGGSSDGTPAYLESLKLPNLRWVSEPDKGIYDAFNKGALMSTGDYLVYICAGDRFCDVDTLERVAAFISSQPGKDIYYADSFEVDDCGNRFLRAARDHSKIWWNLFTHHQSIFYAKACFQNALYNRDYRIGGDYAFTAELLHRGATAARISFPTSEFLLGGTSQQNYWKGEAENWDARRRLGVPLLNRSAIFVAHTLIRWGRVSTPGLYRLFRYRSRSARGYELGPVLPDHSQSIQPYQVAGIEINCHSLNHALDQILTEKRKSAEPFAVFTLNLDHVVKLRKDPGFRTAYKRAKFALPDGFPVALAGRLAGREVTRACGSDLVEPLCKRAADANMSVFFLGSTYPVLSECAARLQARIPNLRVAGLHAPPFGFDPAGREADEVIELIKVSGADICFVALGAPKQEFFAARCLDHLNGTALVCIGAGLDFIVGAQRRAPASFQKLGLEWLWRLAGNPSRLAKRYLLSAYVFPSVLIAAYAEKRRTGISRGSAVVDDN